MSGAVQKFFVRGGFADVTPSGLTILADQVIPLEDLDAAALAQEVKNAEEDLADAGEDQVRRRIAESKAERAPGRAALDHSGVVRSALR